MISMEGFQQTRSLVFSTGSMLLCTLLSMSVRSQDLNFNHVTIEEGLSQSTVYSIVQDADGFMWFGTRDGLNRFDSRKVITYRYDSRNEKTISDNTIYSLYTDSKGILWVGTSNGLNRYDARMDAFTQFHSRTGAFSSLSSNTITCILEDSNKNLWIGTRHGLNLLIPGDSLSFVRFEKSKDDKNSLVNDDIRSVFQDCLGNLWIGTSNGLSRLTFENLQHYYFKSYPLPDNDPASEKSNWINAITEDDAGRLLIGTENSGLMMFDKDREKFIPCNWVNDPDSQLEPIRTLVKDKGGDYWMGTIGGLCIMNPVSKKYLRLRNIPDDPASISDNSVRSLYIDKDGSYWVGTFHGGVNLFSPLSKQFRSVQDENNGVPKLRFKVAGALANDPEDNLWIGTEGNGLFFIDRKKGTTKHFSHQENDPYTLSHNNVKCLLPDKNKGLWVGTIKGLNYFDFHKKQFTRFYNNPENKNALPDDVIYDFANAGGGDVWIGTYRGGLCKWHAASRRFERFIHDPGNPASLSSDGITKLLTDSRQNLWVGTTSGLNVMSPGKGDFRNFVNSQGDFTTISGNYILSIYEDKKKRLWIGTRDNGLNLMSANGTFQRFTTEQGLPGNNIYGILEDQKGYLWISTEKGLSKMDPSAFSFHNYNRDDGLVCKEFNFNSYCKDQSGNFYFGGYNGVVVFHPDHILENKTAPRLAFTGLRLFNNEIKLNSGQDFLKQNLNFTRDLTFRYDQNIFSVEFAVLNYINSQKDRFVYRLSGFETQWNTPTEPVATYMNLKPGRYTLLVKGANNDGVWSEKPLALHLNVLPPPWKSWWAYSIYVTGFLALMYAWARFNRKRIRLEHELKSEHMEMIRQEESHKSKLNFFTNIVHEIRTPLTLMTGPVEQLLEQYPNDTLLKKELTLVKSNTNRLQRLLNQLLDFQRHETGNIQLNVRVMNIVEFIDEIQLSLQDYARSRRVTLNFLAETGEIKIWFDSEEMLKVFSNLLLNAFKFTPGGGEVSVKVERQFSDGETSGVTITIEDNGLGIPPRNLEKIFHRFYQAENSGIKEEGFGIGLALTKGIIDLHHGSISVESKESTPQCNGFTRFVIALPGGNAHFDKNELSEDQTAPDKPGGPEPEETTTTFNDLFFKKNKEEEKALILLVEDNDEIRAYTRGLLCKHYNVLEGSDGLKGWELAVEQLPDLIISDVIMPNMNGLELVSRLKADQRTNHIPVLLLTARGTLNHQVEGLGLGADEYLAKPFNTQLLLLKVKNQLAIREKLKEKYSRIVTLQPLYQEIENPDDQFLQKLMIVLEQGIAETEFNVSKLVQEIGMSRPVLFRKTKMLTGLSVIDLIRSLRLKKAEMLLSQKKLSISEVAFTVGFSDPKYFSKSFRRQYGKTPSQYLEGLG